MRGSSGRLVACLAALVAGTSCVACLPGVAAGASASTGRAYELVSPPEKKGDISADSQRTRAASGGGAVGYVSLTAFGDVAGTGIGTDYVSVRSTQPDPGGNGWATHAITPRLEANAFQRLLQGLDPLYVGEFSSELDAGVFFSSVPVTAEPSVANVFNLYRRTNLRTPQGSAYDLITRCPLCEATTTPLVPSASPNALAPRLAWATPDFDRIAFESEHALTSDAPATGLMHVYEWAAGSVRLAGRIPAGADVACDDGGAPACVPADVSIAGQGAGSFFVSTSHNASLTPHTISDGSDGHSRIFFTRPTDATGAAVAPGGYEGNVYMRVDGTRTVQLNVSERTPRAAYATALFLDASDDGTHSYFSSAAPLTDDAPDAGIKLYMYDAELPASAPNNLTLVNVDEEGADSGSFVGLIGRSADGSHAYLLADGQLVRGGPALRFGHAGVFLWHDGSITYVGSIPNQLAAVAEVVTSGPNYAELTRQARVTPDGRHLLLSSPRGEGLTGYDQSACVGALIGCREFYVYSADTGELACASCNPSGAPATINANGTVREVTGASQTSWHETTTIADDGSRVFFSTAEALVPEDRNGTSDAYEYDVAARQVRLVSSGTSFAPSWFMDASADGTDAFFVTRERLVGWDRDGGYDLYDARIGGGFPEPVELAPCAGDLCQGNVLAAPGFVAPASRSFRGGGDRRGTGRPPVRRCRRGFVKKRVRGRRKCVRRSGRATRRAPTNRRGS